MKSAKLGIISAFIASLCCLGPLLLVLAGLGSLGIGAFIGTYHWYFILLAIGIIFYAWRGYFKEKKACNLKGCQMENKRITLISLIISSSIIGIFLTLNLHTYTVQKGYKNEQSAAASRDTNKVVIPVEGMSCFTCEITIQSALKKIDGVISVNASARKGEAEVIFDEQRSSIDELVKAINKTGFKASLPYK